MCTPNATHAPSRTSASTSTPALCATHLELTSTQGMWDNERHHLNVLTRMADQHRVRPTALYPVWQVLAWGMGATTALMGKEAAMACTEAVETVIGEHYDE